MKADPLETEQLNYMKQNIGEYGKKTSDDRKSSNVVVMLHYIEMLNDDFDNSYSEYLKFVTKSYYEKNHKVDNKNILIIISLHIYINTKHGLTDLLKNDIEELKQKVVEDKKIKATLTIFQAKLNYILTLLKYDSDSGLDMNIIGLFSDENEEASDPEKRLDIYEPIKLLMDTITHINGSFNPLEIEEKDIIYLIQSLQQKVSFALGKAQFEEVRLNDLDLPYHPLEAELLDIIEHRVGQENKLPKYILRSGAERHYKKKYSAYIKAGVIYQDYLKLIDPKLLTILRKAINLGNLPPELLPPKTERIKKLRKLVKNHRDPVKKSNRVIHLG